MPIIDAQITLNQAARVYEKIKPTIKITFKRIKMAFDNGGLPFCFSRARLIGRQRATVAP